jgi:hypothetical protein
MEMLPQASNKVDAGTVIAPNFFYVRQKSLPMGIKIVFVFIGLSLISPPYAALPCTLFGAIGDSVQGGGVLIGKTRDRVENSEQAFIEVVPKGGYRYRGISMSGAKRVTSGVNDKGLVVVSAAASLVEKEGKVTTVGKILSQSSSVDEVMAMVRKGQIQGPIYYLVGDIQKIALLEVIDRHRYDSLVKENGVLCHTNHFILREMGKFNQKIGASSQARLNRIEELLANGPLTKERFVTITRDHFNGPGDNSICRHFERKVPGSERTVSAAVYALRKGGAPEIWVSLGQPCQAPFEKH